MNEVLAGQVDGHQLRLETQPAARLALILDTIDRATSSLALIYYIFAGDPAGQRVIAALMAARTRGVSVALMIDGFGSKEQPYAVFAPLIAAGAKVGRFNPRYGRRYLLRNHQKMLVADANVALIGGCNIAQPYFSDPNAPDTWVDILLRVEGAAVARLAAYHTALFNWIDDPGAKVHDLRQILADHSGASGSIRWLHGGFFPRLSPLTRAIRHDIDQAHSLHLVEAYFAPNWAMLRKLGKIVQRGGLCFVTTAGRSNNTTTVAASRHTYRRLLQSGVHVHEYIAHRLHAKLMIADDATYIGSANFDARSLYINVELMLRIDDPNFASVMRGWLTSQRSNTEEITLQKHAARATIANRIRWLIAYFVVSTLDYRVSRRLNIADYGQKRGPVPRDRPVKFLGEDA